MGRQSSTSCAGCEELRQRVLIRSPSEFRKALRVVQANLDDNTIKGVGKTAPEVASDISAMLVTGKWDDYVEYSFECNSCGQHFRLSVETYRGAVGSWDSTANPSWLSRLTVRCR